MAFENAWLTEEEKKKFEAAKLPDPRYLLASNKYLATTSWTVDREKNIALVYCGVLDRDDYRKETFILLYKQYDREHLVRFTLMNVYFSNDEVEKLKEEYCVNRIEKWKILECKMPNEITDSVSITEIYEILAEAMTAYGISGHPDRKSNIKAIIEGKNGEYYYGTQYN